jgi:predicted nucleotidyltransferase
LERALTEQIEVRYDEDRWKLLEKIRSEAYWMIRPLTAHNIQTLAYGSVARGDVSEGSDIDIFIPRPPSPIIVEAILERSNIASTEREIVQATPSYAAKGYIYIGERRSYSFSLVDLRSVELEFYGFAGSVDASQIEEGIRVPGVDKKLMLIVLDRVRTLTRREEIGRTGVFLSRNLAPYEGFGEVFQELSRKRPAIRRRLRM